jgi:ankyrin repeat protein
MGENAVAPRFEAGERGRQGWNAVAALVLDGISSKHTRRRPHHTTELNVPACLNLEESRVLLALCRAGKLYEIERWIASGKPVVTAQSIKKAPLITAVETGFHSLVELLGRNESRQEQKDKALAHAVGKRRLDLIQVLVDCGANIRSVPFEDALMTWDREIMQLFLDHGADALTGNPFASAFRGKVQRALRPFADYKKAHPETAEALQFQADRALRHFASEGDLKWVCLMLRAGADPRRSGPTFDSRDEDDPDGYSTALDEACAKGNLEVIKKLKPDPERDDLSQLLHSAALSDSVEAVDYLLNLGAQTNDKPNGGSSAVDSCLWSLHWQDRSALFCKGLASEYALQAGLGRLERLLEAGAQWRPGRTYHLKRLRQELYRCEPSVTVTLIKLFAKYKAAPDGLLEELLDTPRMRRHLSSGLSPTRKLAPGGVVGARGLRRSRQRCGGKRHRHSAQCQLRSGEPL